jgi:hypothetical protein
MTDKAKEVLIFETPDGGRTVYSRRFGETERRLHSRDPELDRELAEMEHQRRWIEILAARRHDAELDRLCEQVEILYELTRKSP